MTNGYETEINKLLETIKNTHVTEFSTCGDKTLTIGKKTEPSGTLMVTLDKRWWSTTMTIFGSLVPEDNDVNLTSKQKKVIRKIITMKHEELLQHEKNIKKTETQINCMKTLRTILETQEKSNDN